MFLKRLHHRRTIRFLSTGASKYTTASVNTEKKIGYYRKLWDQNYDTKPAGWEEAKPFEAIPGPQPIPVLGNMWRFFPVVGEFYKVPLQHFYRTLHEKYGNVVNLNGITGRKPIVLLYDVNDMETCLRNVGPFPIRKGLESFIHYKTHTREDVFQGVGGLSILQGEEWYKFRTIVNPILMQPRTVQQYVDSMDEVANELMENMRCYSTHHEKNEMPENFLNQLNRWSLESMGVVAFNRHLGCLKMNLKEGSDTQKFITSVIDMFELMYYLDVLPPMWKVLNTPSWRKYVEAMDYITETTMRYIDECLAEDVDENIPEHELSVLRRLIKLDRKVAVAMMVDMLIAGVDTTARTAAAALYYIARHPEKQKQLRKEALRNLPEKISPVTKDVLNNTPYVKAVVKETTRLAPIGLGNMRSTYNDLVLGGYRIPRDTEVLSLHFIPSLSEKQFKDPEKFIPERYMRSANDDYSSKDAHPFASLPFGFGSRSCAGKRLANLELEVLLLKTIRNFELSWPHEDMPFAARFLYGIDGPLKIRVQPLAK